MIKLNQFSPEVLDCFLENTYGLNKNSEVDPDFIQSMLEDYVSDVNLGLGDAYRYKKLGIQDLVDSCLLHQQLYLKSIKEFKIALNER